MKLVYPLQKYLTTLVNKFSVLDVSEQVKRDEGKFNFSVLSYVQSLCTLCLYCISNYLHASQFRIFIFIDLDTPPTIPPSNKTIGMYSMLNSRFCQHDVRA